MGTFYVLQTRFGLKGIISDSSKALWVYLNRGRGSFHEFHNTQLVQKMKKRSSGSIREGGSCHVLNETTGSDSVILDSAKDLWV